MADSQIIVKEFEDNKINIINVGDKVWFKAKEIATMLQYTNTNKAINDHVEEKNKTTPKALVEGGNVSLVPPEIQDNTILIDEGGLYSLCLRSKMDKAKKFKSWVCNDVLPSIRKTGKYSINKIIPRIDNEESLHMAVVEHVRKTYPDAIMVCPDIFTQNTDDKRLHAYKKGYCSGTPDLLILQGNNRYNGLLIEFKNAWGTGIISDKQDSTIKRLEALNYKVIVSNDLCNIAIDIHEYFNYNKYH